MQQGRAKRPIDKNHLLQALSDWITANRVRLRAFTQPENSHLFDSLKPIVEYVDLEGIPFQSQEEFAKFIKPFSNISTLIVNNENITEIPSEIGSFIEDLDCRGCSKLQTLPHMPELKRLLCHNCTALTALPRMPKLKKLNCYRCTALKTILHNMENLEELFCSQCYALTRLPKKMNKLKELDCQDCPVTELPEEMESLKELNCNYCTELKELPSNIPPYCFIDYENCSEVFIKSVLKSRFQKSALNIAISLNEFYTVFLPDSLKEQRESILAKIIGKLQEFDNVNDERRIILGDYILSKFNNRLNEFQRELVKTILERAKDPTYQNQLAFEKGPLLTVNTPSIPVNGKDFALNLEQLRKDRDRKPLTASLLPTSVTKSSFDKLIKSVKESFGKLSDKEKEEKNTLLEQYFSQNFNTLVQRLEQTIIPGILQKPREPNDRITEVEVAVYAILNAVQQASGTDTASGFLLQEARLFDLANCAHDCSVGQSEGVRKCYKLLPAEFHIAEAASTGDPIEDDMWPIMQELLEQGIEIFVKDLPLERKYAEQRVHYALRVKNFVARQIGLRYQLEYDPYPTCVDEEFMGRTPKSLVQSVMDHVPLPDAIKRIQEKAAENLRSGKWPFGKLSQLFEDHLGLFAETTPEPKQPFNIPLRKKEFEKWKKENPELAEEYAKWQTKHDDWEKRCTTRVFMVDETSITDNGAHVLLLGYHYLKAQ